MPLIPSDLAFTGERFLPGALGEIAHEHWHRYAFARRFVAGRRVVDVASGEGYGSALLGSVATQVTGVDIDAQSVTHANAVYAAPNVSFVEGSATALPLPDACADAIVSFETIEHLPAAAQPAMLAEFARVIAPGGVLVMSSPNRPEYSDKRAHRNPFHLHELDRDELAHLLDTGFPARRWYRQRRYVGSALWAEDPGAGYEALAGDAHRVAAAVVPEALYFVLIAARTAAALPPDPVGLSLFTDADEREWERIDAQAREVMRLDAVLGERDAALARSAAHVAHLEELVAYRDRIVVERDAQIVRIVAERDAERASLHAEGAALRGDLARSQGELGSARHAVEALQADGRRLEAAIVAQERIIAYRQSARWWIELPWLRVRNLWHRVA